MAKTAGMLYAIDAVASLATGWVADQWIRKGHSTSLVRKSAMGIGCVVAAIGLGGILMSTTSYLPWLAVAAIGCGMEGSGTFAFPQTLAGPSAAGLWTGLQNGIANLSGAVGLAVTGFLVDSRGHFAAAFAVVTAIILMGGVAWTCVVGEVEPIVWLEAPPISEPVSKLAGFSA
jgi:MFS family permease